MAKMTIYEMIDSIMAKSNELDSQISRLELDASSGKISQNTLRTQKQVKQHENRNMMIMLELCRYIRDLGAGDDSPLVGSYSWFVSHTTLTEARKVGAVYSIKEGDDVIEWMQEHEKVPYKKIKEYLASVGLAIEGSTVVKA